MTNEIDHATLAARWLQWMNSIETARDPVRDTTGEFAAEAQPDDVWFLAGTYGGAVKRSCELPAMRPLFVPLFNIWGGSSTVPVCPEASGHATLNGVELPVIPIGNSKPIKINRIRGSRLLGRQGVRMWGLWSYLPGLQPGNFHLEVYGEHSPGGFWTRAEYDLLVK